MEMEMDRLSLLPDDLLIHILSLLDLEEAGRSSLLSKRWRYVWTEFPLTIDFKEMTGEIESVNKFKARVYRVLANRRGAALDFLNLKFIYDKSLDSDIDVWVELASKYDVKVLSLCLTQRAGSFDEYTIPQTLYSYPQLTVLTLHHCIVPPPSSAMEWRSMKNISLRFCALPQHVIDKIISACPTLIHMKLIHCYGFNRLEIGCPTFCTLKVYLEGFLEISAPYMTFLDVGTFPQTGTLHLTNVVSLKGVTRQMEVFDEDLISPELINNAQQTFQNISFATILDIEIQTIKAISKMGMHNFHLPLLKVETMTIPVGGDVVDVNCTIAILQSSPFLKMLTIFDYKEESTDWDLATEFNLSCDLPHLKTVEIMVEYACKSTFLLAKTLLKRGPFLKVMRIYISINELPSPSVDVINIFKTLRSYPKSSEEATIEIYLISVKEQ